MLPSLCVFEISQRISFYTLNFTTNTKFSQIKGMTLQITPFIGVNGKMHERKQSLATRSQIIKLPLEIHYFAFLIRSEKKTEF